MLRHDANQKTLRALQAWTVMWEIISYRKKQKKLIVAHKCQKPTVKWNGLSYWVVPCQILKNVLPKCFTMVIKNLSVESLQGGGGGGGESTSGIWTLTSENGSFPDLCRYWLMCTPTGGSSSDRILWPFFETSTALTRPYRPKQSGTNSLQSFRLPVSWRTCWALCSVDNIAVSLCAKLITMVIWSPWHGMVLSHISNNVKKAATLS